MATLEDLTTYDKVLAVLGVDESELPETVFNARDLWTEVDLDIAEWLPSPDTVDTLLAASEDPDDDTDADIKMKRLRTYASYFCAWLILQSGDLLFSERIADGQNENQRSKRTTYGEIEDRLAAGMARHRTNLLALYDATLEFADAVPTFFSAVGNLYDPATNTRS